MTLRPAFASRIVFPHWSHPNWIIVGAHSSFVAYSLILPGFSRQPSYALASIATCVSLELLVRRLQGKELAFPLSAIISALGLVLLTDSYTPWGYALVGALSILSKHLLTINGRHIFNPTNFGIVVANYFFTGTVTLVPGRWGGTLGSMLFVLALGLLLVYRAKRLWLSLGFSLAYFTGALILAFAYNARPVSMLMPMTGAAFMLFVFFMITDPQTSPSAPRQQLVYGALVGILATIFRNYWLNTNLFLALFVTTALYSYWRAAKEAPHHRSEFLPSAIPAPAEALR